MTNQEFRTAYPQIAGWIQKTLGEHAATAKPVASLGFRRLPHYFDEKILVSTTVVLVSRVPVPPLLAMGLTRLGEFEQMDMAGITYLDTYFVRDDHARDDHLLYRPVLPKDYRALLVAKPVTGTVVVEASPWVEDNQWVLDLAAHDPFIVGLVGNLPVGTQAFAGHLKRFTANKLFRGIRLRDRKLDGALDAPAFVSDLKLLAGHDLSLDLVGGREILGFADRLAKEMPKLRIIIDHLAGVVVDGKAPPADWLQHMRALARRPGIYCKLSGLVEGTGRSNGSAPRDTEFYRPVLDAMLEMFGPERLIYASNWPVSERFAPLATVQGIVAEYFRSHGRRAEEQVFWQSAKAAYRWVRRVP